MREIDTSNLQDIMDELDGDFSQQIEHFNNTYPGRKEVFAELTQSCLVLHEKLPTSSINSEREKLSKAYGYFAIDCAFTSFQQLMIGYILPSGNLLRSSLESIALSSLFAHKGEVIRHKNKKVVKFDFYEDFRSGLSHAKAHRAIETAKRNWEVLGIEQKTIVSIDAVKSVYGSLSHASPIAMAARVTSHDQPLWILGGDITYASEAALNREIDYRVAVVKIIEHLLMGLCSKIDKR
jgi:hypothetical protein